MLKKQFSKKQMDLKQLKQDLIKNDIHLNFNDCLFDGCENYADMLVRLMALEEQNSKDNGYTFHLLETLWDKQCTESVITEIAATTEEYEKE